MEVVVLLVAIVGVALVVIPRLQRRRASGRPSPSAKVRKSPAKRRRTRKTAAAPAVIAPAVATWTPPASPAAVDAPAAADLDGWDDDLGWEGEEGAPPEAREEWERWRTTESPLASALVPEPEPEPEPEPQLPSVERWRAKAEEEDWFEDDGLGWEGEAATDEAPEPHLWNGNAPSPAPDVRANGSNGSNGSAPAPESDTAWDSGRDWSRGTEAPTREADAPPAFATAATTDVAPAPAPEVGRTIALEDDDWDPPVTQSWGVREETLPTAAARVSPAAPRRRPRTSRIHPVLLVAIYAAAGILLVVLVSTALLGESPDPAPAAKTTPTPAPAKSPAATPQASATPDAAAEEAAAAAAAAEREARVDFGRARSKAMRSQDAALSDARAAARREAKAKKARAAAKDNNSSPSSPSGPPSSTPVPTYTPPSNPAPTYKAPVKRRSVCEFCIG